jgi:YspA, cpYpsA-related SLOG family
MRPRRILVTGSRDWMDRYTIAQELVRYITENAEMLVDSHGFPVTWDTEGWVIVHGDCPTGADHYADDWGYGNLVQVEPHPAQWRRYGKAAGFRRNVEMVDLGADVCLAFINPCTKRDCPQPQPHGSHGTTMCAALAETAGIETRRFGFVGDRETAARVDGHR